MTNKNPRGISGKFTQTPVKTAGDVISFLQVQENGYCLLPPPRLPFGFLRESNWYVPAGEYTGNGRRKVIRAIELLYRSKYPVNFSDKKDWRLKRLCDTAGCLNYQHYDLLCTRNKLTFGERYMSQSQVKELLDKVLIADDTISFGDASSAESFRLYIYRLRRDWKKNNYPVYERYEDVIIKKDKLHPNILEFTVRGRAYAGAFEQVLGRETAQPVDMSKAIELPENFDVVTGEPAEDALASLGFTSAPKESKE